VRSLGFQPEPSSHDWHVQPSCQRTDPLPPERALSVQSRITEARAGRSRPHKACLSSKLVQTTRLARSLSTHGWHRISTCFPQPGNSTVYSTMPIKQCPCGTGSLTRSGRAKLDDSGVLTAHAAKRFFLSTGSTARLCHFGTSRGGRASSLKKDHLEVSANNAFNPSRNLVPE